MLTACLNKNKPQTTVYDWDCLDSIQMVQDKEYEVEGNAAKEKNNTKDPDNHSPAITSSSSDNSTTEDNDMYDNMRGFDPASEDDMDDNGMSRYMENNDEEGWD